MVIAICDDNMETLNQILEESSRILGNINVKASFLTFQRGEDLLAAIEEDAGIDILLLDIDMPGISGLETAKIVREKADDIILIFISSHEHYVFDSLEYHPFRYIRKSRMKQELVPALRTANALYQRIRKRYILVKCEDAEYRVEQSEIAYFEVVKRKLCIHLADGRNLIAWKSMKDLQKEVPAECFVKIHSGCVVNLKYVSGYSGNEIMLDNGERLTASRAGMKVFKSELTRYWSR